MRPCRIRGKCYLAVCNEAGRCWCDKFNYYYSAETEVNQTEVVRRHKLY